MIIDYNICSQSKAPDPMDWELYYVFIVVNWRRYVARGSRLSTFGILIATSHQTCQ